MRTSVTTGSGSRWIVSGKIGARPRRKERVKGAQTERSWVPTDISAIVVQDSGVRGLASEIGAPGVEQPLVQTGALQPESLDAPAVQRKPKPGRSTPWRSGIVPLGGVSPMPVRRKSEPVQLLRGAAAAMMPRAATPAASPVVKAYVPLTEETLAAAAAAARHEAALNAEEPASSRLASPKRRKAGAAYMPIVAPKQRMMDHVEKLLFGRGNHASSVDKRIARSSDSTACSFSH